jgi:ABC-type branched-subunit amino acid transport system substrate-binding protein
MKKLFLFALISLLLIVSLTLGACSSASTTSSGPAPAPATSMTTSAPAPPPASSAVPPNVLKLGTTAPMNSPFGLQAKKWFDLYSKIINDGGGLKLGGKTYQVQIIVYDDQGDVTKAEDNIRRLVLQDGCKYILGGQTNQASVDVTITEPNKVLVVGSDQTNNSSDPKNQYYFTTGNYFTNALQFIIERDVVAGGAKSYVSVKPDNQMGHFIDNILAASWKIASPDIKNLGTVFVDPATVDFGPVATKVVNLHPDCADLNYLGMIPNSVVQMYRALADNGFKGVILPGIISKNDVANLNTMVGKDFIEGGEVFSQDPTGYQKDPRMLSFFDAYVKTYGKLETDNTAVTNGMFLLEEAFNATQSVDVETIKAYLDKSNHPVRTSLGWEALFARPDLNNLRTICGGYSHPVQKITNGELVNFSVVPLKDQYLFSIISNRLVDTYKAYWAQYGYPVFPDEEKGKNSLKFSDFGIIGQD